MRIIYVYTHWCETAVEAIRKHAPDALFIETPHLYDYNAVMFDNWNSGEDLVVIEEDKVVHYGVIPAFADCDEPWCVFGYSTYPAPYTRPITFGLGCTKFSAAAQREFPATDFMVPDDPAWGKCYDCDGAGCWRFLDSRINKCMLKHGYQTHLHGWVEHLHQYPDDWGEKIGQYLDGFGPIEVKATIRRRSPVPI